MPLTQKKVGKKRSKQKRGESDDVCLSEINQSKTKNIRRKLKLILDVFSFHSAAASFDDLNTYSPNESKSKSVAARI
jgi:hypothetical protein